MRSAPTGSRLAAAVAIQDSAEALSRGELRPGAALAGRVLDAISALVPSCAAAVECWDPVRRRHDTVASTGYVAEALAAVESAFHTDPLFPVLLAGRRPLRVSDVAPADRHGPMFDQVIRPLRYSDGVSVCLSVGPRYVGSVHASTTTTAVDDEAVFLLRLLAADLATLVDPLGGIPLAGAGCGDSMLAWRVDDGTTVALSPDARCELLRAGSPLAALLHPARWPSRLGRHLLVVTDGSVLAVEARPSGSWVVVEHRPAAAPAGLSLRELEVLAALAGGSTNRMTARALGLSERTVGSHVEHLLLKLGVGNRAAAAAFAVRIGLVHLPALT
jgi:DNA-binding CsgD family transcriptional regulator